MMTLGTVSLRAHGLQVISLGANLGGTHFEADRTQEALTPSGQEWPLALRSLSLHEGSWQSSRPRTVATIRGRIPTTLPEEPAAFKR